MQSSTLQKLEESYAEFPGMRAEGVAQSEIDAAAARFGIPFPADYQEFLRRYGGGHTGSLSVAGLRRWEFASRSDWSVIVLTEQHRAQRYPGTERWVIFSDDGFGNPVGFDDLGRVGFPITIAASLFALSRRSRIGCGDGHCRLSRIGPDTSHRKDGQMRHFSD
jgi:hypothetical protein